MTHYALQCGGAVLPNDFVAAARRYTRNGLFTLDARPAGARFEPHPLARGETLHRFVAQDDFTAIVYADDELVDCLGPERMLEDVWQQFQHRNLTHALHCAELAEVELLWRVVGGISRRQHACEKEGSD